MAAGGMSDEHKARRERRAYSTARSDVLERAGPAAAGVADAAVLDVERRDARVAKGDAQVRDVREVVRRLPRAAVHDDREPVAAARGGGRRTEARSGPYASRASAGAAGGSVRMSSALRVTAQG